MIVGLETNKHPGRKLAAKRERGARSFDRISLRPQKQPPLLEQAVHGGQAAHGESLRGQAGPFLWFLLVPKGLDGARIFWKF